MHSLCPADELAEIRAEILRLKVREALLRSLFLKYPDQISLGRWTRIAVLERRSSVFDAALLPAGIRDNPAYRREKLVQYIQCQPLPAPTPRPGWPIQREARTALH